MPAYNVGAYIGSSLGSLIQQTIREIEIVVVNDGSTDATEEIATNLAGRDPRIRVVRTPRNLGIAGALNYGLQFCRAPYIARIDGDDLAVSDRIEKQHAFLQTHPDTGIVGSATRAIDEGGNAIGFFSTSTVPLTQEQIARTLLLSPPCAHIWMARREVYDKLSGYREVQYAEDYDFLLRAITAGFRIGNLPEALTLVRVIRSGNTADSAALKQRKAKRYVVSLYRERLKGGSDSFSPDRAERSLRTNRAEETIHGVSVRFVQHAFRARNRAKRLLLLCAAAIVSPWQAIHLLDRFRYRLALRQAALPR